MITLSDDPVVAVSWSADGGWLACRRGHRRRRPHPGVGGPARRLGRPADRRRRRPARRARAVDPERAPGRGRPSRRRTRASPPVAYLADPATGDLTRWPSGELISVLDLSVDESLRDRQGRPAGAAVLRRRRPGRRRGPPAAALPGASARPSGRSSGRRRDGRRSPGRLPGHRRRPAPPPAGRDPARPGRLARATPGVLAPREDAELEGLDADDAGRLLLLVWNTAGGGSELELLDTATGGHAYGARTCAGRGQRRAAQPRRQRPR